MTLPNKENLRLVLRKQLTEITNERKYQASLLACHFLRKSLGESTYPVLSFASKPFEINLWPLNRWLADQKRLILPKIVNDRIEIYEVSSLNKLRLSPLGILEPNELLCPKIESLPIDSHFLIPALGFDASGGRIGHGKGHYDRFLSSFSDLETWGIGFQEQKCTFIPTEEHDFSLDDVFFF